MTSSLRNSGFVLFLPFLIPTGHGGMLYGLCTPFLWVLSAHHERGPLHTQAKSRDHEIVKAQKKVSKGRSTHPPKSCSVVMDPQV